MQKMTAYWKRNSSLIFAIVFTIVLLLVLYILDINRSNYIEKEEIVYSYGDTEDTAGIYSLCIYTY